MSTNPRFQNRLGTALVTLQFALIVCLAWQAWPAVASGATPRAARVFALLGVLLGVWAIWRNRLGNFNIRPAPRLGGTLVRTGPYRWIRHPMYTAVMACGVACAWTRPDVWTWLALLLLVTVLAIKARFEERWMLAMHPDYAEYSRHTRRFIPWLF